MGSERVQYGIRMGSPCVQHGIRMDSEWVLGSGWSQHGIKIGSARDLYGFQDWFRKGSAWDQDEFSMESGSTFKLVSTVKEKVKNGSC
jgi:hypothetical protein